ncbi:TIGR03986 family CRISPR-associated RAMP protein [Persephonella sp. KM09-Lau-8]|uniref:TIGR03986 family type III CRISPR-associated RAMP protein n=1 Tax=Persephonella sp. KM09-Lau-8 TaxID=1158345 RepID=UPI00068A515E|nr:TIGR03986 family CRISPR-associated RAMP protein [Persephonella sp. KM09-Lau-8]
MKGKIVKEKGKLVIKEIGSSKSYPILGIKGITDNLIGKECEFELKGLFVKEITLEGKVYTKEGIQPVKQSKSEKQKVKINTSYKKPKNKSYKESLESPPETSKAPYNFVPLNKEVVLLDKIADIPVEVFNGKEENLADYKGFSTYHSSLNTGYIEIEIEALTPIYIRDGLDEEEVKEGKESKDKSEFFNINGVPKIPGSSLRGMIRTLVEIVSFGKFKNFEDKRLYFRAVGDKTSFGKYYRELLDGKVNGEQKYEIFAGLLKKEGRRQYSIYRFKNKKFYRVKVKWTGDKSFKIKDKELKIFNYYNISFDPKSAKSGKNSYSQKHPIVENIVFTQNSKFKPAYLVASGKLGKQKRTQWILDKEKSGDIDRLSLENIEEYQSDTDRKSINVLERKEYPVFYLKEKNRNRIKAFGHTRYFRVPYEKKISEHIPEKLKDDERPDFAEAIFGKEGKWAGRVYFEDAVLISGGESLGEKIPRILAAPKPTAFQHYLEQKGVHGKERNHWDTNVLIRGYKLYWHKDINKNPQYWLASKEEKEKKNVITKINPLNTGAKFKGKIRFENLTDEELGALLFVLDLPENHYHKIGMAKPLGLGSIKITPKLYLIDTQKRYESLFEDDNWNLGIKEVDIDEFKSKFENFIKIKSKMEHPSSLWEHERLKELKAILNWENTKQEDWLEKTDYQELKEFRDRKILGKSTDYGKP